MGKNIKYIKTRPASVVADDHEVQVSLVKELLAIKDGMLSVPFISQIEAEDLLKYLCTYRLYYITHLIYTNYIACAHVLSTF